MDWNPAGILLLHIFSYSISFGSEIIVQVNTKKWMYYVPERFLSLSVDPLTLAAASPLTQESYNMAKGLHPSFVRIGGIGTSALIFGKEFMVNSSTVSESQWDSVNDFARGSGLDIIASLNPSTRGPGGWESQNSAELISYSNKKRYNVAWQLGYDLRGYNASGTQVGKDLMKLAKILDGFSMYAGSPVFSPDLSTVSGAKQLRFVKDLMMNAGNSLGSLILQPKFINGRENEDPYDLMTSMINELDTYVWNKEVRIGKAVPKKPIWIAEPTASQGSFREAMKLVKRLGVAARTGVQIYLRQAGVTSLKYPTPDFWFSLLYKTLVGQGVLDNKIVSEDNSDLYAFSHCTPSLPADQSVLDTDWNYDKGAVTVFGVNESPEPAKLVLKVTSKEEPLHIYILTSTKKNENDKIAATFLNGQELMLSPTWDLPVLSPRVKRSSKSTSVIIPGESIYFIVMPESKIRTCSVPPLASPEFNLSELAKRLRLSPQKLPESVEAEIEPSEEPMEEGVYVAFVKKKRHDSEANSANKNSRVETLGKSLMQTLISKLSPKKLEMTERPSEEEMPVKYITFNKNSFLNKLAEGVKEELKVEDDEATANERKNKYEPLTSAMFKAKPQIITIQPIQEENVKIFTSEPTEETNISRSRRSCNINSPQVSKDLSVKNSLEILKGISEAKRNGTPMNSEMKDVVHSLKQVEVTFKKVDNESDKGDEKSRKVRHIGNSGGELINENEEIGTDDSKKVSDSELEREKEKICDDDDEEEDEKKTSELMKIVQQTEKVDSVSESPESVIVTPEVTEKKLDEMMLETAKLKSEPEPDDVPQTKDEEPSTGDVEVDSSKKQTNHIKLDVVPLTVQLNSGKSQMPIAVRSSTVPDPSMIQSVPINRPNIPIITAGEIPVNQILSRMVQSMNNPTATSPQQIQGMQNIQTIPKTKMNYVQKIASSSQTGGLEVNDQSTMTPGPIDTVPMLVSAEPSNSPEVPYYNEEKENAINKILTKIATEEDSRFAQLPPGVVKPGIVANKEPLVLVSLPSKDTIVMASEDVKTLTKEDRAMDNTKTLESESAPLDLTSPDDKPSVKVLRQVEISIPKAPTRAVTPLTRAPARAVTPLTQTATLSTPSAQIVATTTAGPVSPFKSAGNEPVKLPQVNQQREPLKAPTSEELRERFKSLQEKMLELRSQYVEARERRLEEIKKQVASRGPSTGNDAEDAIKSTIRRREAELKEWFKKFDKREIQQSPLIVPLENVKSRPRRLSLFSDSEGLDMEKFFNDNPVESYNFKRSPELNSQSSHQNLPTIPDILISSKPQEPKQQCDTIDKRLFPLDTKTHGIVYNNKIYPARFFGFIEQPIIGREAVTDTLKVEENSEKEGYIQQPDDIKKAVESLRGTERLAVVPKDAFIREAKSDSIQVIIIPPDELDNNNSYDKSSHIGRAKRSTLSTWEEQFHQIKEDILPKISTFIKRFSENPPWKRDLERSSRNRRSIDDIFRTNDLQSLKILQKIPHQKLNKAVDSKVIEIEDLILKNVNKGENELHSLGEKYTNLADKIAEDLTKNDDKTVEKDNDTDIKYCEEIGTSQESIIRDPFNKDLQKPDAAISTSILDKKSTRTENGNETHKNTFLERMEESMIASVISDQIKQVLARISDWLGIASDPAPK